jgi:hypothetical protein
MSAARDKGAALSIAFLALLTGSLPDSPVLLPHRRLSRPTRK